MRFQIIKLYWRILFEERKQSIYFLLLNGISELTYNICIVSMPSIMIAVFLGDIQMMYMIVFFFIFWISILFKKYFLSKMSIEKELQDQILIMKVTDKMNRIPYYLIERQDIKEKKESCIFAIQNYGAIYDLYSKCIQFFSAGITLTTLLIIAFHYRAYYMILVIVLSLINIWFNARLIQKKRTFSTETIRINYLYSYFQEITTQKKYQINNRLYQYSEFIMNNIAELNTRTTKHFEKIRNTEANYLSLITSFSYLQSIVSYVFPIIQLSKKIITIDTFVLIANCGINVAKNMDILSQSLQEITQAIDYLLPLYELMNLPEENEKHEERQFQKFTSLEFKNISFRYGENESEVLQDINFQIYRNDTVAILGLNGAGKTTLIKLLLRLYIPTNGEILLNGVNIYQYDESYIQNISVVFQDCKIFPLSIYENISPEECEEKDLIDACEATNFKQVMDKKQISFDSLYSSEIYEEGIEFSGGEKQLLAITRAYKRNGELFILDEPSSALDPIMTNQVIENFEKIIRNRTTILITHDISLAKKCKRILKIENGRLHELK